MSIAELHGKLSPESANDRQEDLLTSDVFGTMYYAGWEHGFLDWLLSAKPAASTFPQISSVLGLTDVGRLRLLRYTFWPTLINKREPDIALSFELIDGTYKFLIIEVKYGSGLSNCAFEIEENSVERSGHQLVNQLVGISGLDAMALVHSWFDIELEKLADAAVCHLLITADHDLPSVHYVDVFDWFSKGGATGWPCPAYWLSWRTLVSHLKSHVSGTGSSSDLLIRDLILLLERKELTNDPYEGFRRLQWPEVTEVSSFWKHERWFQAAQNWRARTVAMEGSFWKNRG